MKQILIYTLILLYAITTLSARDKATPSLIREYSEQESGISAPTDFYLWCLEDHKILPENFDNYSERFQVLDGGNTHYFQTYPGDWCYRNGTTEKYTRIEAFEESRFNPGSPWHEFEATYEIDTESTDKICFFQLKSHENELPQLMCHITAGKLTYQPQGKGARTITTIANKQNFKIKVRCNGDQIQFYYNDGLVYAGEPTFMMSNVENYFRWGIYNNLVMDKYMSVRITNIKLGITPSQVDFVTPEKDTIIESGYSELYAEANVSASQNVINSVKLFLDGKLIGEKSSPPYLWGGKSSDESNPFYGLSIGTHSIKVVAYNNTTALDEQTRFVRVAEVRAPYKEMLLIPGKIEAEDYDFGGEGIAYHDFDNNTQGGVYRNDGVDIEAGGSDFVIGNTVKGEWMEYTIDVGESGEYDLRISYSSGRPGGGARISVSFPNENIKFVTNYILPETNGWSAYNDFSFGLFKLEKGIHVLRIAVADYGFNLDWIEFKKETYVGIKNNIANNINVHPNPSSSGQFNLSESQKWEVFTMNGIKIKEGEGTSINLSQYSEGVYLLKTQSGCFKLIIKRE